MSSAPPEGLLITLPGTSFMLAADSGSVVVYERLETAQTPSELLRRLEMFLGALTEQQRRVARRMFT